MIGRLPACCSLSELLGIVSHAAQLLLPSLRLAVLLRQPDAALEIVYCNPPTDEPMLRVQVERLIDQGQIAQALTHGFSWSQTPTAGQWLLSQIATQRRIHGLILWSVPGLVPPWQQILGTLADLTALGLEWLMGDAQAMRVPPRVHLPLIPAFDGAIPAADQLTGLAHRVYFLRFLQQAILSSAPPCSAAILLLDIDGFQRVNQELGYEAGDCLLCELALPLNGALRSQRVQAQLRVMEHNIYFARTGADEFGIAIAGLTLTERLEELAAYLHSHIAEGFLYQGSRIHLSISIGIAATVGAGETTHAHTLLGQADTSLKRAKQLGRDRYALYEPGREETATAHLRAESLLQEALRQDLFSLVFQPQFDLSTDRLAGAEVLLRLALGDTGAIPPSSFIPVAESTGQIIEISQWMIRRVCRQLCAWDALGVAAFPLSVKISAVELSQPQLTEQILAILGAEGIAPHRLHLEITETAIAQQESQVLANLKALRTAGFAIWIDDFGISYSSLKSIKRYPAHGINLDREFIQDLERDLATRVITRSILELATALGYPVVAEGIEDVGQYGLLRDWGCPIGQGYLLGRPIDALEFQQCYLTPAAK
ncbi:putative bifunctional diguanylate cyclase/phosphodiesterase [Caldichromatium japonicum]|uniref:putative bifunctional diguanylate cyclase/phosphodiesterase n=1 Tax=Caldichromatium japonicum TaxID=2699430 RepID=UPI001FE55FBE|nr:bifunctional diguanylate cyclase/phosphodiesterase [Caldichromatium japonicum]